MNTVQALWHKFLEVSLTLAKRLPPLLVLRTVRFTACLKDMCRGWLAIIIINHSSVFVM